MQKGQSSSACDGKTSMKLHREDIHVQVVPFLVSVIISEKTFFPNWNDLIRLYFFIMMQKLKYFQD